MMEVLSEYQIKMPFLKECQKFFKSVVLFMLAKKIIMYINVTNRLSLDNYCDFHSMHLKCLI